MSKRRLIILFTIALITPLVFLMSAKFYRNLGGTTSVLANENTIPHPIPEVLENKDSSRQVFGTVQAPPGGFDPKYIRSALVTKGVAPNFIPITGKLAFNAERTNVASARVAGRINKILVFEGHPVEKGQPLAELFSPDFISAEKEYLLSLNTLRTIKNTGKSDLIQDAQATLESSRNKLRILGASDDDVDQLEVAGVITPFFLIRTPITGIVIKRNMDAGSYLNLGDIFENISDTRNLWFLGNIYEQDYAKIKIGQTLQLQSEALPGRQFTGRLSYIFPSIDPVSHTLSIRCEISNLDGELRPEVFVTARLLLGDISAIIVPKTAVVHIKNSNFVIVDLGNGSYQRVSVNSISIRDGQEAVLSGLTGHEKVVIDGATLINEMIGDI
ncbi:MAG: efflux RND transporter periplasmic adaptor subunit [Nitrospiria bacterium]